jgi:hypothetical protein
MEALFRYLVRYETTIYILLGLGALFAFRYTWVSWNEWRKSVFGLEKEMAYHRFRSRGVLLVLILLIALSQFCMVSFVVPYLPAITFAMTRTPDLLTNNLNGSALLPEKTPEPELETAVAQSALLDVETGCTPGQISIDQPQPRQEISGRQQLVGTVNVQNFGFYKYEYRQSGAGTWVTIAANRESKIDAEIGVWDTSLLEPGDYEIRLVVIDNDNNPLPACVIPVRILQP